MSDHPMREVVHIDEATKGPRGGRAWMLTLDCGHITFRKIPPTNAVALLSGTMGCHKGDKRGIKAARERQLRQLRGAPHKAMCYACPVPP